MFFEKETRADPENESYLSWWCSTLKRKEDYGGGVEVQGRKSPALAVVNERRSTEARRRTAVGDVEVEGSDGSGLEKQGEEKKWELVMVVMRECDGRVFG